MTKVVLFKVGMTCGGCSGAVTRILSKIEGVDNVETNLETKDVKITCVDDLSETILLESLQNWSKSSGKSVELIGSS
jgi:copper chaperone